MPYYLGYLEGDRDPNLENYPYHQKELKNALLLFFYLHLCVHLTPPPASCCSCYCCDSHPAAAAASPVFGTRLLLLCQSLVLTLVRSQVAQNRVKIGRT